MFRRLKIKHKLLLINFLSILGVLLFASAASLYDAAKTGGHDLHARMGKQARLVANNSVAAILFDDWDEERVILNALSGDSAVVSASAITARRRVDIDFKQNLGPDASPWYVSLFCPPATMTVGVPVMNGSTAVGAVEIRYRNKELLDTISNRFVFAAQALALSLAMGVLLSLRLQSMVTRPITQLSETARNVKDTKNYSIRATFHYPDEIGGLTHNFNEMLQMIEFRDDHLEREVELRTEQLKTNYEELRIQIERRETTEKASREIQQRFEQAFTRAPIGMALVDRERRVIMSNDVMAGILSAASAGTSTGADADADTPSLRLLFNDRGDDRVASQFAALTAGELPNFDCEVTHRMRDDARREFIANFSAVLDDHNAFKYAVLQLQDVTKSSELARELHYQATHDALTRLPNRRVLIEQLSVLLKSAAGDRRHALCMLDLDQFKIVNDMCGHLAGDAMLQQLSTHLSRTILDNELLIRLGGDEFAMLIRDCTPDACLRRTEAIRASIEKWDFHWEGRVYRVGVSIGVALIDGSCREVGTLMRLADSACYLAKDLGRNQTYMLTSADDLRINARQGQMLWVQKVHEALRHHRFVLFCQPILPLRAQGVAGHYEILLRMHDPVAPGMHVLPGLFLPAAERYGLSSKIDRWVVETLIDTLQRHPELTRDGRRYWVNLSGISVGDVSFLRFLEDAMAASGLPASAINFEITETAIMQNVDRCRGAIERLKSMGCGFALDDFGSGISSFGYLKTLPVDYLKIDGMFVRDILTDGADLIFVQSIIDIARTMGLKTVAEFVESEAIRDKLAEIGADFGQGFALGRPAPLLDAPLLDAAPLDAAPLDASALDASPSDSRTDAIASTPAAPQA